jgi:glutathione S-transferase
MKLYYSPGACSLAAHIVAEEEDLGLELEQVDLKAHKTESGADYYEINPKGYVPALKLDDGKLLTENVAILQYLGDREPEDGLTPPPDSNDRYQLQEWLGYITGELHKSFAPLFKGGDDEAKIEAKENISKRLKFADDKLALHPYLMGAAFSVADAYLFVMLTWCDDVGIDTEKFAHLAKFKDAVAKRDGVKRAMRAEGLI